MLVFLLLTLCTAASGGTIYVDADAIGANDGSSWTDAYNYLKDALTAAAKGGGTIWVAQGTYRPNETSVPGEYPPRTPTFTLLNGVAIYGGFDGTEDPASFNLANRDFETNETILSGDLGTVGDNSDNSYHVVTGRGMDATAILDGFTITAGNANGPDHPSQKGSGMYNHYGSPTVTNCTFSGNSANTNGGGMYSDGMVNAYSSPTVTNCTFSGNSALDLGGGMYNGYSSPTVTNCTFSGNSANHDGGGMFTSNGSPTVTNCTFSGNSARFGGGGMVNWGSSSPTVTNCTFIGNTAKHGGGMFDVIGGGASGPTLTNCTFSGNSAWNGNGGGMNNYNSSSTITNCTFSGNSASLGGGGMYNRVDSSPTVTNCILWGDSAPSGPEIFNDETSSATVSYSDVQDGWSGLGNIEADPLFADADGRLLPGSPCIDAGDDSAVLVATDLDGNPRIVGLAVDMGAFELADPVQSMESLAQQVIGLNLQSGIENSLDAKLDAVLKALDDLNTNNDGAAINALEAFINAVEAQRGNKISDADADTLIAAAQQIIDLLMAE